MNKRNENANKGFSLVELIIVVAIMAVLIGILAPTYLKYVEKSRVTADQTMVDEFRKAMEVLASDPEVKLESGKDYSVKSEASTGKITFGTDLPDKLKGLVDTGKKYTLKSTEYRAADYELKLTYDTSNKLWIIESTFPNSNQDEDSTE